MVIKILRPFIIIPHLLPPFTFNFFFKFFLVVLLAYYNYFIIYTQNLYYLLSNTFNLAG